MKPIMGKCPYTDNQIELAYRLDSPNDILALVQHKSTDAGMTHISVEYMLNNFLVELGGRPTEFPCIAVVDVDWHAEYLGITYVTHTMFEV